VIWCTVLPIHAADPRSLPLCSPGSRTSRRPVRPAVEISPTRSTPPGPPPPRPRSPHDLATSHPCAGRGPSLSPGGGVVWPPPDGAGEARCPPGGAVVASGYHGGTCTERFSPLNPTTALVNISLTHLSVSRHHLSDSPLCPLQDTAPASAPVAAPPPPWRERAWRGPHPTARALPLGAGAGSIAAAAMDKRMLGGHGRYSTSSASLYRVR
jgi:hypothetical protein